MEGETPGFCLRTPPRTEGRGAVWEDSREARMGRAETRPRAGQSLARGEEGASPKHNFQSCAFCTVVGYQERVVFRAESTGLSKWDLPSLALVTRSPQL